MEDEEGMKKTLLSHGYEYIEHIGRGSFSSVLLCKSQKYQQNFAIKRSIKHRLTHDEYAHLVALNHPNIIRLYDAFDDDSAQYLVMEYCTNGTLKDKTNLSYDKFVYYAKQILESINFIHSNKIAHRDIKPENIFLDQYDHIKLADFGMAKYFEDNGKSSDKCGSLLFVAPEMLHFQEVCPFKADIWALGITFFYMATGSYPFNYTTKDELKNLIYLGNIDFDSYDMHPKIRFLLSKMTIKDHVNRPTAKKLLEFPMFTASNLPLLQSKSAARIGLAGYRTNSSIALNKSNCTININLNSSDDQKKQPNIVPKPIPLGDIRSYRSLNFYPNINRVNSRPQPSKKIGTL